MAYNTTADARLCHLTIAEAATLIGQRQLSPVELTQAHLERIEALDPRLHCFITVDGEGAMAAARVAEAEIMAGNYRGPLHGIPVAHKDILPTAGLRTTAASKVLADWTPREDATAVARLRAAGTVLLGKLVLSEFAFGYVDSRSAAFLPAVNPWQTDHVPGGSSSGSAAALAAGLCMGALGSDTGGSIRGPAGNCNVVGLKPTYGLVSRAGALAAAWSLDHVGPMSRTVYDNALLLGAMAGYDERDPASADARVPNYAGEIGDGLAGLRLGVPSNALAALPDLSSEVAGSYDAALDELKRGGAQIVQVEIPHLEIEIVSAVYWTILRAEVYAAHRKRLLAHSEGYGSRLRQRVQLGALVTAEEYLLAQRGRSLLRRSLLEAMTGVDLVVTPTSTQPPKTFHEMDRAPDSPGSGLNRIYNLAGVPAISVPCGFTQDGLPLGLQFAGRPFDEPLVYRAAHAYEQATDWHKRRAPVDALLAHPEAGRL